MYGKDTKPSSTGRNFLTSCVSSQIWNIFEGGSLFTGCDPEFQAYRSRAHLAEIIRLLGPPPPSLLARGKLRHKFFSDDSKPISILWSEFLYPLIMYNSYR